MSGRVKEELIEYRDGTYRVVLSSTTDGKFMIEVWNQSRSLSPSVYVKDTEGEAREVMQNITEVALKRSLTRT